MGRTESGGIKPKNEWVHTTNWDLVIFDEYHFGAWRDNAKNLFENPDEESSVDEKIEATGNEINEDWLPITTKYYLYLSGTPFRALNSGEFIEEQIFSWTYSDEQAAKENWESEHKGEPNPYAALPKMVLLAFGNGGGRPETRRGKAAHAVQRYAFAFRPQSYALVLAECGELLRHEELDFRVQSPWTVKGENGKPEIIKKEYFVFDFSLNRTLRQISDYSRSLSIDTGDANEDASLEYTGINRHGV